MEISVSQLPVALGERWVFEPVEIGSIIMTPVNRELK